VLEVDLGSLDDDVGFTLAFVRGTGHARSHLALPVDLDNNTVLGQLLLDEDDFFHTLGDKVTACPSARVREKKAIVTCLPQSIGHSFIFTISGSLLLASTQCDERSMMGMRPMGTLALPMRVLPRVYSTSTIFHKEGAKKRPLSVSIPSLVVALTMGAEYVSSRRRQSCGVTGREIMSSSMLG